MPGPMSIPDPAAHRLVKVIVGHDEEGEPIFRKIALANLTGLQRVAVRGLYTGKTTKKKRKGGAS